MVLLLALALLLWPASVSAFDMCFDFRASAPYVTDASCGAPVLGEAYPHTFTNANGDSINAGWPSAQSTTNELSTNDPRIAGSNYRSNSSTRADFQIDLSSGSAPGAGQYTVDLALGWSVTNGATTDDFKLFDNTTVLIDGTNGGSGFSRAGGHYVDATLADVAATNAWTGTTTSQTFASTTALLAICIDSALPGFTAVAHVRLTKAATTATTTPQRTMTGVGL